MYPNDKQPLQQHPSDFGDLFDAARKLQEPKVIEIEHDGIKAKALLCPNGQGGIDFYSVKDHIDEYRAQPERRRGTIAVDDLDSFIALVNRDKNDNSMIFARRDKAKPRLTALLDFHISGGASPRFCEDRIRYDFPLSEEWETWNGKNGKSNAMSQVEFARFIEDNIFDIGEPGAAGATAAAFAAKLDVKLATPQRLMEVSRGLELNVKETVANVINLASGEVQLVYGTEHQAAKGGGPLNIPAAFHIMIPIFKGGARYSIPVRLRHRHASGQVSWFYELHREDMFLQDAINEAIEIVRRSSELPKDADPQKPPKVGCGLPVVLGTPPRSRINDE